MLQSYLKEYSNLKSSEKKTGFGISNFLYTVGIILNWKNRNSFEITVFLIFSGQIQKVSRDSTGLLCMYSNLHTGSHDREQKRK